MKNIYIQKIILLDVKEEVDSNALYNNSRELQPMLSIRWVVWTEKKEYTYRRNIHVD